MVIVFAPVISVFVDWVVDFEQAVAESEQIWLIVLLDLLVAVIQDKWTELRVITYDIQLL